MSGLKCAAARDADDEIQAESDFILDTIEALQEDNRVDRAVLEKGSRSWVEAELSVDSVLYS